MTNGVAAWSGSWEHDWKVGDMEICGRGFVDRPLYIGGGGGWGMKKFISHVVFTEEWPQQRILIIK